MNYLFVHSGVEWSGSARAFAAAAKGLARRGHSVAFVVEPGTMAEQVASESASAAGRSTLFSIEALAIRGNPISSALALKRAIRVYGSDAVFVHSDREHLVAAIACRLGARARIIRRIPAGRGTVSRRTGRIAAWLAPACYLFSTERESKTASLPRKALGRVVAPLGVAEALPQSAADLHGDEANIVAVHDASSRSRAATAVRTVAMLAPRHPALRLVVVGEGSYDDDLRMQSAALDALDLVSFLGDRADHLEIMRSARLGWVVAEGDAGCFAILDLMSIGVPVLAPEHSVAQDYILNDITGVLLPPDDAFTTAATVADLLVNDSRRETMGAAARARAIREFTETEMVDGFERAAAEATARNRRR